MMTYVTDQMRAALAGHRLRQVVNANGVQVFRMAKPGTGIHDVDIVFLPERTLITGDITIGPHEKGVASDLKYGFDLFRGNVAERWLCEKFLRKVWVPAVALDALTELHREYPDRKPDGLVAAKHWAQRFVTISGALADTAEGGAADVTRSAEVFADFWMSVFDGDAEYPGHDYDPSDAGWLCAIQQRFAELYREREARIEAIVAGWEWQSDTAPGAVLRVHGIAVAFARLSGHWSAFAPDGCALLDSGNAESFEAAKEAARAAVLWQAIGHPELWWCGEVDE